MNLLFDEVSELKDRARRNRKRKRFDEAVRNLDEAILKLQRADILADDGSGSPSSWETDVAKQLADCYGSRGGVYREAGDLAKARDSYDEGYLYEADARYEIVNSYNLVQRLVVRILLTPELVSDPVLASRHKLPEGLTVPEALAEAARRIAGQVRGPRRGDSWALADLALLNLLMNDEPAANALWDEFDATNPSPHAYGTTAEVLRALASAGVVMRPALSRAAERLERR